MMRSCIRSASFWIGGFLVVLNFLLGLKELKLQNYYLSSSELVAVTGRFKNPETIAIRSAFIPGTSSFDSGLEEAIKVFRFENVGPDYGDLKLQRRVKFYSPIVIDPDDYQKAESYRNNILETSDTTSTWRDVNPESDRMDIDMQCRRVSWAGYNFPSCNKIHELLIERVFDSRGLHQPYNVSYLNCGSYREAWRFKRNEDHVVVKRLKMGVRTGYGALNIYRIRKEAIMLERLLPSPKVVDIYGHCGTTVLSEAMSFDIERAIILGDGFVSQEELDKLDNVYPRNNLTTSEKLQISLDMAEALAALHGFEGGSMTLGDTHIEEWLVAPDGTVKLNDLNLAIDSEWDERAGKYCDHHLKYGKVHRSPEEYTGDSQDESVDTYAYGNMIYSTLTGLWPFYHEQSIHVPHKEIQNMIVQGTRPFIDPRYRTRSFIEGKLVEVMEKCWAHDRGQRPSMFDVVTYLRDVKREAAERDELQKSNVIKITSNDFYNNFKGIKKGIVDTMTGIAILCVTWLLVTVI